MDIKYTMPIRHNWNKFRIRNGAVLRDCIFILCSVLVAIAMIWVAIWTAHAIAERDQFRAELHDSAQAYKLALAGEKWKKKEREAYIAEAKKTDWKRKILEAK